MIYSYQKEVNISNKMTNTNACVRYHVCVYIGYGRHYSERLLQSCKEEEDYDLFLSTSSFFFSGFGIVDFLLLLFGTSPFPKRSAEAAS